MRNELYFIDVAEINHILNQMQYPSENLPNQEPKLLYQVRAKIRLKHYSIRTG
jgi:hypothetical protein